MKAWEQFLAEQEHSLGKETVKKWLYPLVLVRYDARNIYLEANDSFQALWFEEHVRKQAQTFFAREWNGAIKIHVHVRNAIEKKRRSRARKNPPAQAPPIPLTSSLSFDPLDHSCSFSYFVVTEENAFACRIASEMSGFCFQTKQIDPAQHSWGTYNPLYIFGKQGSGKTHFLMALTHAAKQAGLHALYLRGKTFTDHVVAAIRAGEMGHFRDTYRNADILLIDEVDSFSGKGGTQEELFHTFNALHLAGKQIVLAAEASPNELKNIEPRLVSRFAWGLACSLPVLEGDDRLALVHAKLQAMNFSLSPKILDYLCQTFKRNPHTVIRAVECLALQHHRFAVSGKEFPHSIAGIQHLLERLIQEEEKKTLTPPQIMQTVTEYFGIRKDDILGKAQTKECVLPRQIAMFLCRSLLKLPFMRIGELFARDHSTVMSSIQSVTKKLEGNHREVAAACRKITDLLQAFADL